MFSLVRTDVVQEWKDICKWRELTPHPTPWHLLTPTHLALSSLHLQGRIRQGTNKRHCKRRVLTSVVGKIRFWRIMSWSDDNVGHSVFIALILSLAVGVISVLLFLLVIVSSRSLIPGNIYDRLICMGLGPVRNTLQQRCWPPGRAAARCRSLARKSVWRLSCPASEPRSLPQLRGST